MTVWRLPHAAESLSPRRASRPVRSLAKLEVLLADDEHRAQLGGDLLEELVAIGGVGQHRDREVEAGERGEAGGDLEQLRVISNVSPKRVKWKSDVAALADPGFADGIGDRDQAEDDEEGGDEQADRQHLHGLAGEQDQGDVAALLRLQGLGVVGADLLLERTHLTGQPGEEEDRPEADEEQRHGDEVPVGDQREHLPHLGAHERQQGEDHQQRDGARKQHERGEELVPEAPPDPLQDRDEPVAEDRVDQEQQRQVGRPPSPRRCASGRRRSAAGAPGRARTRPARRGRRPRASRRAAGRGNG